jgi:Family of unknown function (DUF6502)
MNDRSSSARSESLKVAVRSATLRILDPLVRWLLEAGVGVGDLLPLVKMAYVRAAREQGLTSGGEQKRPNASRISVVTGLTRKEVASILAAEDPEPARDRGSRQRAERVLSGWWNDRSFQDSLGAPAVLPVRGSKRSFAALVERYSGERWRVATILEELLRVKAVRRLSDGRLQALSRTYATVRWDPAGVMAFGEQLSEHCATLLHNLRFPAHAHYVRRVLNSQLDPRYVPMLTRDLAQHTEALADSFDDALNDPQQTLPGKTGAASLGIAFYVFEVPPADEGAQDDARRPAGRTKRRRSSRAPKRTR